MTPQQKTVVVFLIAQPVRPEAQILIGLVDEHEGGVKSPLNTMAFRPLPDVTDDGDDDDRAELGAEVTGELQHGPEVMAIRQVRRTYPPKSSARLGLLWGNTGTCVPSLRGCRSTHRTESR